MNGPARSLSVGDECPTCGREITETTAGGLLAYCWWCNDHSVGAGTDHDDQKPMTDGGVVLAGDDIECPACGTSVDPAQRYRCPSCGKKNIGEEPADDNGGEPW